MQSVTVWPSESVVVWQDLGLRETDNGGEGQVSRSSLARVVLMWP